MLIGKDEAQLRWIEYVHWSLHHGYKDHISLSDWREMWDGGLIR